MCDTFCDVQKRGNAYRGSDEGQVTVDDGGRGRHVGNVGSDLDWHKHLFFLSQLSRASVTYDFSCEGRRVRVKSRGLDTSCDRSNNSEDGELHFGGVEDEKECERTGDEIAGS